MTTYTEVEKSNEREKANVAASSVLAAVFITAFKLVIGLMTHSLGIMAEAAHSGLDLVAAAVTFFAVRISGKPPDEKQMFGYGKVENLSALFETLLLFVTCIWIIYEAVQRLFFKSVQVEVSPWSFIVMAVSIIVDVTRSRALMKAAKKHGSQALEADALHFSTDVWSSSVVIGGLILVTLGEYLTARSLVSEAVTAWLHRADALAALGVSIIVIYVSYQLGRRTIDGLLDRAPQGLHEQITREVSKIPGLVGVRKMRIRPSGPITFVDMVLDIPRNASFEQAHQIGIDAKAAVKNLIPRADVMVHMDPIVNNQESTVESVKSVVTRNGMGVHSIRVYDTPQGMGLEMHVEVPETLSVAEAHARVSQIETEMHQEIHGLGEIVTHIEPLGDTDSRHKMDMASSEVIQQNVMKIAGSIEGIKDCHSIILYQEGDKMSLSCHCNLSPEINIADAHRITGKLERQLLLEMPDLDRVYIHVEPTEDASTKPA